MTRTFAVALTLLLILTGCRGTSTAAPTIDREAFIATWIDLRAAAVAAGGTIPPAERDRVLREHGVDEEALVTFVDVHGADPAYMVEVWTEVEERMRAATAPPASDTVPPAAIPGA